MIIILNRYVLEGAELENFQIEMFIIKTIRLGRKYFIFKESKYITIMKI